ncbi:MAG: DUF2867 domain-containing protein [Agriterribacter sp.]
MRILLTGATGYIGQRLLPVLIESGHQIVCCVRDKGRLDISKYPAPSVTIVEANLLEPLTLMGIPEDIDAAFYLVHSLAVHGKDFEKLELASATHFRARMEQTRVRQIVFLSGIVNEDELSPHLQSRKKVDEILHAGAIPVTTLRAGIIVGSGSASFEIIRDIVEKLPFMIAPRWLKTQCQPIAIRNVISFLCGVLLNEKMYRQHFDIYGVDTLTYKEMLLRFAKVRGLKRTILIVPVLTPHLSSYWLYFVTSTSYAIARNLVESMKVPVIAKPNHLAEELGIQLLDYETAIRIAFDKIEQNLVLSSWKDAQQSQRVNKALTEYIEVPTFGCMTDKKTRNIADTEAALDKIFSIGGDVGWYYGNWMWNLRGFLDQLLGGVGRRRGRKNKGTIAAGESLDFWRVIFASRKNKDCSCMQK